MRLLKELNALNEDASQDIAYNEIAELIKKDCGPWIKKSGGEMLLRGMSVLKSDGYVKFVNDSSPNLAIGSVRNDRVPSASPIWLHNAMNEYFKSEIGIPLRSACIFGCSSIDIASTYSSTNANIYSIYPIGEFNYAWSPLVYDPTYEFYSRVTPRGFSPQNKDLKNKFEKFWQKNYKSIPETRMYKTCGDYFIIGGFRVKMFSDAPGGYEKMVAKFMMEEPLWKFNHGLKDALDQYPQNEIMISCDKYYAVPYSVAHIRIQPNLL